MISSSNLYRYNGKEEQQIAGTELAVLDYGARTYDPWLSRWTSIDPLAAKYHSTSPYAFCNNSPVNFVDPWGMDWYSTSNIRYNKSTFEYESYNMYHWTDAKSQDDLTALGINGTYLGEAVVVFDGYYDEQLGEDGTLTGEGAKTATVTVYGPKGKTDIDHYIGYTMSSDPSLFGEVENGIYPVNKVTKLGPYSSPWVINNRGEVPAMNGFNPAYPDRNPGYLNGVFVHRNNKNGFTGTFYDSTKRLSGISEGCLIISSNDWDAFNEQLNTVTKFTLSINRQ